MRLHHVTIRTADLERSIAFYRVALGLEPGDRPQFSFPGAWLAREGAVLIHLKAGVGTADAGPIDHVAFHVDDFDACVEGLRKNGIAVKLGGLPDGSLRQCVIRDPDGTMIELTGV